MGTRSCVRDINEKDPTVKLSRPGPVGPLSLPLGAHPPERSYAIIAIPLIIP